MLLLLLLSILVYIGCVVALLIVDLNLVHKLLLFIEIVRECILPS